MSNLQLQDSCNSFDSSSRTVNEIITGANNDDVGKLLKLFALHKIDIDIDNQLQLGAPIAQEFLIRVGRVVCLGKLEYRNGEILKCLGAVFKKASIPLFVDNFGEKVHRDINETETWTKKHVQIDSNTEVHHGTHIEQKKQIDFTKMLEGTDNKNAVKGIWFGLTLDEDNIPLSEPTSSRYGPYLLSVSLKTLGIKGLRLGELIKYKQEFNAILYPDNDAELEFDIPYIEGMDLYLSIFLPKEKVDFNKEWRWISVDHSFCVKSAREYSTRDACLY